MRNVTTEITKIIEKMETLGKENDYTLCAQEEKLEQLKNILDNIFLSYENEETKEDRKEYAVVETHTLYPETKVYLFTDYKKACEYLESMWQHFYNMSLATNPEEEIDEDNTYHEEDYAQIKWGYEDNNIRRWKVEEISEPMQLQL